MDIKQHTLKKLMGQRRNKRKFKMNLNKNKISNLWDAVKALLRKKSIGINAYFFKKRKSLKSVI